MTCKTGGWSKKTTSQGGRQDAEQGEWGEVFIKLKRGSVRMWLISAFA